MMTPAWNDLANSARWCSIVSFIRNWVGPFDSRHGMVSEELDEILRAKPLNLPVAVREWYQLAANWHEGGDNVWIDPQKLTASDGIIWLLTDTYGVNLWGVRVADFDLENPPVVSHGQNTDIVIVCPKFSRFVAAITVNDVIFNYESEAPVELNPDTAQTDRMCLITSCHGDFFADGPLKSATVVMFAYPENGPVYGKSRTPTGRARLQSLQRQTE